VSEALALLTLHLANQVSGLFDIQRIMDSFLNKNMINKKPKKYLHATTYFLLMDDFQFTALVYLKYKYIKHKSKKWVWHFLFTSTAHECTEVAQISEESIPEAQVQVDTTVKLWYRYHTQ